MITFNISLSVIAAIGYLLMNVISGADSEQVAREVVKLFVTFLVFGMYFHLIQRTRKGFSFSRSILTLLGILNVVFAIPLLSPLWKPSSNLRLLAAFVVLALVINLIVSLVFLNTKTANVWFRELRAARKRAKSKTRNGGARDSAIQSHLFAPGAVDLSGNSESIKRYLIAACLLMVLLIASVIWVGINLSKRESTSGSHTHEVPAVVERVQHREIAPKKNTTVVENDQRGRNAEKTVKQPSVERPKDGDECFRLGCQYLNGDGVVQNDVEAFNWFQKGSAQGNAGAQCNLGWMYDYGRGVPRSYSDAMKWYLKAAENGSAIAQCNLGWFYEIGKGTERNNLAAVNWYRKAADQGLARAQFLLGNMYLEGKGVLQSDSTAADWYKKAAEQGHAEAQNKYGWMISSGRGVLQNDYEAFNWFKKAAEQGVVLAQARVGYCYSQGVGVERNDDEAVKWYLNAAEQGNAPAQCLLGGMYAEGRGVVRNNDQAWKWRNKSGMSTDRADGVGIMLLSEHGFSQSDAETYLFLEEAANRGSADAQFVLGLRYLSDRGTFFHKDERTAASWIKKAAARGHHEAQEFLKQKRAAIADEKRRRHQQQTQPYYDFWAL